MCCSNPSAVIACVAAESGTLAFVALASLPDLAHPVAGSKTIAAAHAAMRNVDPLRWAIIELVGTRSLSDVRV